MPSGSSTSGVGRIIAGRCLLLHRLGGSGAGRVWLAHDQRLGREVALAEVGSGEVRHTPGLRDHPHVVTVLDVLEHEGLPWVVMEYVSGALTLRELVGRRGPLAPAECARVGLAVLDALTAGHRRDVRPANVLLAPDRTGAPHGRVLLSGRGYPSPDQAAPDLFSLGRTLYYGVEGRDPFAGGTEQPWPAVRAGALGPVVDAMLAPDPALRPSAAEVEAELSRIVVPQAEEYSRPGTDPGSQPQWAIPGPPVSRSRGRHRILRSALSGLLGLALAGGGVWYAVAGQGDEGGVAPPYGEGVGLARALQAGDCVLAHWPRALPFQGTPRLTLDPSCADKAPHGQVMGFVTATSAEQAMTEGPARCERLTQELRGRLADVRAFAVVPTEAGFEPAGRRTACLVLGAHGPVYGPLGGHRAPGSAFADPATMQRRDCLDVRSKQEVRLVSCTGPHDEQVLGFTRLAEGETRAMADRACARDVAPRDYGFDPSVYTAGSWTSRRTQNSDTHFVVCTVRKQNRGTMEGDEP
ncbi:septum formation family protein [Streptomyces sp. NPDC003635]